MPRLSVCIPTYNGAKHLERCLRSLLAQTETDLKLVLCDDASTDATLEVAERIRDARLEVHAFPKRLGLSGNWNRAWSLRGDCEYVALVGQDDSLLSDWSRRLIGLLEAHPDAHLAFSRRRFEFGDEESRRIVGDFFENRYPKMLEPFYARIGTIIPPTVMIEEAMRFLFEINLIGEPSFVVMRSRHPAVQEGFDARISQLINWELYTRFFADAPIAHWPEVLGSYHIHGKGQSVTNAQLSKHYQEYELLLSSVLARFDSKLQGRQKDDLLHRREEVRALAVQWSNTEAHWKQGPSP